MSSEDKAIDGKVLFWAMLGPSVLLLACFTALVKAAFSNAALPALAVIAGPLCWKWRMKGLYLSLGLLLAVVLLGGVSSGQYYWQLGLSVTFAISFVVMALSFEEVRTIIDNLLVESKSRLENLWRLDEKLKTVQERWSYEREDFSVRNKLLGQEVQELRLQLQNQRDTLNLAKEELARFSSERNRLAEGLLRERQSAEGLEERLRERGQELQGVASDEIAELRAALAKAQELPLPLPDEESEETERELRKARGLYKQLREQFDEKDRTLHEARVDLFKKDGELHLLRNQVQELQALDLSRKEKEWEHMLKSLEADIRSKEEEVSALNTLVSQLFDELSEKSA